MKRIMVIISVLVFTVFISIATETRSSNAEEPVPVSKQQLNKQENILKVQGKLFEVICGDFIGIIVEDSWLIQLYTKQERNRLFVEAIVQRKPTYPMKKGTYPVNIEVRDFKRKLISRLAGTLIINDFKQEKIHGMDRDRIKGIIKGYNSKGDSINAVINSLDYQPDEGAA